MKTFRKLLNSGILGTILSDGSKINSQPVSGKCSIHPGDIVTCNSGDLGRMGIKTFEEIAAPKGKAPSLLKAEISRIEGMLRPRSMWLNPGFKAGVGQFLHLPADSVGLMAILADMEDEGFNPAGQAIGAMSAGKLRLKAAWSAWDVQCKNDPNGLKSLKSPEGEYLEAIALAEAQLSILKGEISEVRRRLSAAVEVESGKAGDRVERLRFKGHGRLNNGLFVSMDARQVHYVDGKPVFVDNGQSIADYKVLIKEHKAKQSKRKATQEAKAAKQRREQAETVV
jgi:hypothetical protein